MRLGQKTKLNTKTKRPTANRDGQRTGAHEVSVMSMAALDGASWLRYMRNYYGFHGRAI